MVLTGDMFNFFVFLEITSISSAALVAFRIDKPESVEAEELATEETPNETTEE